MNATTHPAVTTGPFPPTVWRRLLLIKNLARLSIGLVWFWEGLVPKIFYPSAAQIDMVYRSGWWWGSPDTTLHVLGIAMMVAGVVLMLGIWERLAVAVSTLAVLILMVLVIGTNPAALYDPYGGLVKDGCLFVCAALVWWWPKKPPGTV